MYIHPGAVLFSSAFEGQFLHLARLGGGCKLFSGLYHFTPVMRGSLLSALISKKSPCAWERSTSEKKRVGLAVFLCVPFPPPPLSGEQFGRAVPPLFQNKVVQSRNSCSAAFCTQMGKEARRGDIIIWDVYWRNWNRKWRNKRKTEFCKRSLRTDKSRGS